jgi:large subunit ribosomal protein L18
MTRFSKKFTRRADRVHYNARCKSFGKLRLSVFRSNRHIYAQIIDDVKGMTLCAASTLDNGVQKTKKKTAASCEDAGKIGSLLGERAIKAGIKEVVFDRGGCNYHGRVKALAEGARSSGLVF